MGLVIGVVNSQFARVGGTSFPVTTGHEPVGAYLSVVDNATGDPTFIAIPPRSPAGGCRLTIALDQGAS